MLLTETGKERQKRITLMAIGALNIVQYAMLLNNPVHLKSVQFILSHARPIL